MRKFNGGSTKGGGGKDGGDGERQRLNGDGECQLRDGSAV